MTPIPGTITLLAAAAGLALAGSAFGQAITFAPAATFAAGPAGVQPVAIAARDVDRDGKADLAVVNGFVSPGTVGLLFGTGSGSFSAPTTVTTAAAAFAVAFGDFNADGAADLAVAVPGAQAVSVFLGTGSGSFGAATSYAVGLVPSGIVVGDFNRDAKLDLAVANQVSHSVSILLGAGNGTFGNSISYSAPVAFSLAVGDFDGDGNVDLAASNGLAASVSILVGDGTGSFSTGAFVPTGVTHAVSVAVGDLNGDGKADLVVGGNMAGVSVMLGNGNGTFAAPLSFGVGPGGVSDVALADFNGDGRLDVAACASGLGGSPGGSVFVLAGDGTGSLAPAASFAVGAQPRSMVVGDFNRDGLADLAVANVTSGTVSILLNTTAFVVSARAWGDGRDGALGDGTTATISSTPVVVQGLTGVTAVAAGAQHSAAVRADGTVWSWGAGFNGALGNGTTFNPAPTPVQVSGLTQAVAVAAGVQHTLALMADGTVQAWGLNSLGQLGDGTTQDRHTPVAVSGLSGVVAVAAGGGHSLALKADGSVWGWGRNDFGQVGDGTTIDRSLPVQLAALNGVVAIAAGASDWHSLAVKADGSVRAWGRNHAGQLGDGTQVDRSTPVQVAGLGGVKAVAGGTGHSVAVKADGSVWSWGSNMHGQLGNGTLVDSLLRVQVPALTGVVAVTAGMTHTLVLKSDGTVWGWGANSFSGQLGDGTLIERLSPVQTTGLAAVTALATGGQHSAAIIGGANIGGLIAMVQSAAMPAGIASGMLVKLEAAEDAVAAGRINAACGQLVGFASQVRAQVGRALAGAVGDRLLSATQAVQGTLGCAAR